MTQVLIAVDDSDASIKTARIAYDLFGDSAGYIVVNVAEQTPVMWGGDALVWGVGYPVMLAPAGTPQLAPPGTGTAGTGTTSDPDDPDSATTVDNAPIDAAIQVARGVAAEADLPTPQVVGEVGDPATAIINAAHHHHADVIVVGSHHRNWFSSLLSPSVSNAVVREADIPVLIAR
jgi:nucleotide-binding universal stress UspA family protein